MMTKAFIDGLFIAGAELVEGFKADPLPGTELLEWHIKYWQRYAIIYGTNTGLSTAIPEHPQDLP